MALRYLSRVAHRIKKGVEMNWTELLNSEIETSYKTTQGLLDLVDPDQLDWKPATGSHWMTVGQLLHHLSDACGAPFRGFVTGDWGMPQGEGAETLSSETAPTEAGMPGAESMPALDDVAEARRLLASDKVLMRSRPGMSISTLKCPELERMAPSFMRTKCSSRMTLISPVRVQKTSPSLAACSMGRTS